VALKNVIEKQSHQKERDCQVQLLLLSSVSNSYQFLLPDDTWFLGCQITREQIDAGALDDFDLIMVVDTSAMRQLEGIAKYLLRQSQTADSSQKLIIIDHHLSGDLTGDCSLTNTSACAAGEIVYNLFQQAGWPLDENSAAALFVAVGTDTGWFRFENTSSRTFQIAGELIRCGAQPDQLYQQVYQNDPPEKLKLLALTLQTLQLYARDRLAVIEITKDMLSNCGAKHTHIENIVNEPHQIGSVIAVLLFVEQEDGTTRVSLRSKSLVDVNEIARQFGGGGHARAAGVTLSDPIPQAREKLINAVTTTLD